MTPSVDVEIYRPDWRVKSVADIPFRYLANQAGVENYIFDYHNTLAGWWPWDKIPDVFVETILHAKRLGFISGLAIASNVIVTNPSWFEDAVYRGGAAIGADGIYCFGHKERKPKPDGFRRLHNEMGWDPTKSIIVGDQFNDVAVAHRVGCRAILIEEPVGFMPPWVWYKNEVKGARIRRALGLVTLS